MTLCVVVKVVRHQGRTSPGRYLPTVGWTLSKNVPGWAKQCVVYYGLIQGARTKNYKQNNIKEQPKKTHTDTQSKKSYKQVNNQKHTIDA